jgi:uncharacterized iron-regulated protein
MSMSLTKDDLKAVKQLIDDSIDGRVPKIIDGQVQPMLDKLEDRTFKRLTRLETRLTERIDDVNDKLAQRTAAGFVEVHDKIDGLSAQVDNIKQTVKRIELLQRAGPKHDKLKRISKIV